MIISKTNKDIINKTFQEINKQYEYNLFINKLIDITYDKNIKRYKLYIMTLDKNKKGARININNKFTRYSCIHVYYDFFNKLLENDCNAVIQLYGDWIIMKNKDNKIINNNIKNYENSTHVISKESFLCRCKKENNK